MELSITNTETNQQWTQAIDDETAISLGGHKTCHANILAGAVVDVLKDASPRAYFYRFVNAEVDDVRGEAFAEFVWKRYLLCA
jgi:hypothetical protein